MTHKAANIGLLLGASIMLALAGCATPQRISGSISGPTYTSSQGGFSVPIPVSAEVGGRVLIDGPETVTFHDNWGSRITFSSIPFNAQSSMTSALKSQGREVALTELAKRQYGTDINTHYHPGTRDGTISFIFVRPVGPRTGAAMFVGGGRVYIVETDMLPGVQLLAQSDDQSQADRLIWLEGRAVTLAETMNVK
jgi:hypothetical protein